MNRTACFLFSFKSSTKCLPSNIRYLKISTAKNCEAKTYTPVELLNYEKDGFCAVYVDGACLMNGRRGAVGGIGVFWGNEHPWNVAAPLRGRRQTSGRAEIQAACEALRIARHYKVEQLRVYTDSVLVAKGASEWIFRWRLLNWNVSLQNTTDWHELDELLTRNSGLLVDWCHVRGHSQLYGNEQAHLLASIGAKRAAQLKAAVAATSTVVSDKIELSA